MHKEPIINSGLPEITQDLVVPEIIPNITAYYTYDKKTEIELRAMDIWKQVALAMLDPKILRDGGYFPFADLANEAVDAFISKFKDLDVKVI